MTELCGCTVVSGPGSLMSPAASSLTALRYASFLYCHLTPGQRRGGEMRGTQRNLSWELPTASFSFRAQSLHWKSQHTEVHRSVCSLVLANLGWFGAETGDSREKNHNPQHKLPRGKLLVVERGLQNFISLPFPNAMIPFSKWRNCID